MISNILKQVSLCHAEEKKTIAKTITPFHGYDPKLGFQHHFFLFLKPEILSVQDSINTKSVLTLFFDHCKEWEVYLKGIKLYSGKAIQKNKLIEKNYETLFILSNEGMNACSESVIRNIDKERALHKISSSNILGGHQFLRKFPHLSPSQLNQLIETAATQKFGSGAYIAKVKHCDEDYLLINAFHPRQIESLSPLGGCILALECFSNQPWSVLRNQFVGTVVPAEAPAKSFRRKLYEEQNRLNLKEVNISNNGIHISPGPLEAAFQFKTFFSNDVYTLIEDQLVHSYPDSFIEVLAKNPHVKISEMSFEKTLFEQTEDMCSHDALEWVKHYYFTSKGTHVSV